MESDRTNRKWKSELQSRHHTNSEALSERTKNQDRDNESRAKQLTPLTNAQPKSGGQTRERLPAQHEKILTRLTLTQIKSLDLNACPTPTSLYRFCGATDKSKTAWFLRSKTRNCDSDFDAQITKPPTLILRLNQKTCAHRLLVHGADHKQCHPTSWSSGHRVPNLYLTISSPLHQVSYSCLDPRCYPPCRACHLHTMRQANTIFCMKMIKIKPPKSPGFEFKTWQVNDSSQSKQDTDYIVSQSFPWSVHWQQKAQSFNFESKTQWSTSRRLKAKKGSTRSSRRRKNNKTNKRHKKQQTK
jgi:hypothetical protein